MADSSPQDRIRNRLDWLFRQGRGVFPKLTKSEAPYRFAGWRADDDHRRCLYYEFDANDPEADDHEKRVPLEELVAAIEASVSAGYFDRQAFFGACPVARSAGDCGYAVTGRCLELLEVAEHVKEQHLFRLTNEVRARLLLVLE